MLTVHDLAMRVAAKVDDSGQTFCDEEYVVGLLQDTLDWLFGKLRNTNNQFDEDVVVLGAVPAGTPNLDQYMLTGQPLAALVLPKFIRWRLPGQGQNFWRKSNGPLDYPRDVDPGGPNLNSWAFRRYSVQLAKFTTALDLEITGDFLFAASTDPDSAIAMSQIANRILTSKLAAEVGKARGNDKWVATYGADADDALDDLTLAMSKENQRKTHRVGRMNRRGAAGTSSTR